jgi:hypothetical protein
MALPGPVPPPAFSVFERAKSIERLRVECATGATSVFDAKGHATTMQ